LEERKKSGSSVVGISSGIQKLDLMTKGWKKSQLIVVAARTSVGKTAFSVELSNAAIKDGKKTYFASLEMEGEEVMQRMQSNLAEVPVAPIEDNTASESEMEKWNNATKWLKKNENETLWIDDESSLCFSQIRARARKIARKGLDFMVVDYVQIISSERGRESERDYNRVSYASRMMKVLARELGIPIILLAQLSRKADEREGAPKLSDLKESGSLEQDADIVLLLWKKETAPDERVLTIAKQRNGRVGDIELSFDGATSKFKRKPVLN
jgi:replicative DNA helicase